MPKLSSPLVLFILFLTTAIIFSSSQDVNSWFSSTTIGKSTWYGGTNFATGECSLLVNPYGGLVYPVAIDSSIYGSSIPCGMCMLVWANPTTPVPPSTLNGDNHIPPNDVPLIVWVIDSCGGCDGGYGPGFDFYNAGGGAWLTNWTAVDCPVDNYGIQFTYFFQGSNPYYLKLQVNGHRLPISSLTFYDPNWQNPISGSRTSDNFFTAGVTSVGWSVLNVEIYSAVNGQTLRDTISLSNGIPGNGQQVYGQGVQFSAYRPSTSVSTGSTGGSAPSSSSAPVAQSSAPSASSAPVSTGTPGIATQAVYTDGLVNGWQDWSWASVYSLYSTANVYYGSYSISYTPQNWDGLYFTCSNCFSSSYYGIYFRINGGYSGGQTVQIQLRQNYNSIGAAIAVNPVANSWQSVSISMSQFGASGTFDGFIIQSQAESGSGGPVYIDQLYILGYDSNGYIAYPPVSKRDSKRDSNSTDDKFTAAVSQIFGIDATRIQQGIYPEGKRQFVSDGITVVGVSPQELASIQDVSTWLSSFNDAAGTSLATTDVSVSSAGVSANALATTAGLAAPGGAGLATGALAGIIVGSVVGGLIVVAIVVGVIAAVVVVVLRNKNSESVDVSTGATDEEGGGGKKKGVDIYPDAGKKKRFKSITGRAPTILFGKSPNL